MTLNLVETWDEAQLFMAWLGERRQVLAVDTETGGLEWWQKDLRLVQFGDARTGWAVPWQTWGGLAKDALHRYSDPLVFHNMKFDLHFLEVNGCTVRRDQAHDTRTLAHLLDPVSSTGLKQLGVRYIDPASDSGQSLLKRGMTENRWTWATVPVEFPPYWTYSALDTVLTARLYELLRPQVTGRLEDVYELEIACNMVLLDMERRGARVDVDYCEVKQAELLGFANDARRWCDETYGFGPGSNKKVAAQLMTDGIVLTKRTESGAWSLDEEVLSTVDHQLARTVLNVRKAEKMANSYFGNYIELADDGILHPDVNALGARTGRMSVSRPALQQIPRTAVLRDPFVPREGNRLLSVDFDQIEQRLVAHFSGDEGMVEAFAQDGDFFTNLARRIFQDPTVEKSDPRRQRTKSAAYAKAYGSGVAKFAKTAGCSEAEAQQFLASYDAAFPGVRRMQRQIEQLADQRFCDEGAAYVTTPLGRRQPCDPEKAYKLVNYLVQGTAADMFKQALVDLDRKGLAEHLVLPVHDEAVFDVPADAVDEFAREVVETMSDRGDWRVPMTAGADVMDRWGDKYR